MHNDWASVLPNLNKKFGDALRNVYNPDTGSLVHKIWQQKSGVNSQSSSTLKGLPFDQKVHKRAKNFMNSYSIKPSDLNNDLWKDQLEQMYQRYGKKWEMDIHENPIYQEQLSSIIGPQNTEEGKDNFYVT